MPRMTDDDQINAIRDEIVAILVTRIQKGTNPEFCATAAVAAGAMVYAVMMGGVKSGKENDAVQVFGRWIVDMIISVNNDDWLKATDGRKQ